MGLRDTSIPNLRQKVRTSLLDATKLTSPSLCQSAKRNDGQQVHANDGAVHEFSVRDLGPRFASVQSCLQVLFTLGPHVHTSTAFVSKLFGECTLLRGAPQCFPRSPPKTQHPFRHTFASQVAREPLPNHSCIGCHLYSVRKCVYSGAAKVWKTRNHVVAASRYSSRPDIKSRL